MSGSWIDDQIMQDEHCANPYCALFLAWSVDCVKRARSVSNVIYEGCIAFLCIYNDAASRQVILELYIRFEKIFGMKIYFSSIFTNLVGRLIIRVLSNIHSVIFAFF